MKNLKALHVLLLASIFVLSGCTVRTYKLTRDRIDQDLSSGNRGYLQGQAPQDEASRKTTRTTRVVEVELSSPIKFEKKAKTKYVEVPAMQRTGEGASMGNRGYITQSVSPEIVEPQEAKFEQYTVQKNDTLQKISKKYFGTTKKWMKIYNINKDVLKAADKLYPGQVINIPVEEEPIKETKENLK